MARAKKLTRTELRLEIERRAAEAALQRGKFIGGQDLTSVQREAFEAQRGFLSGDHPDPTRFYLKMTAGAGKTGTFGVTTFMAHEIAAEMGVPDYRSIIREPSIPLLHQTAGVMRALRPDMASMIGMVGDGKHDISRPITVITQPSAQMMADVGLFTDGQIDRDVDDEAHYSLSERRIRTRGARLAETIHIGFTASDEFDQAKSLRLWSHKIYDLSLPEALDRGILCAYIEPITEFVPIPPGYRKYIAADIESRSKLEAAAWLSHVETHLATAMDPVINEPVREKYAMAFTGGTRRADYLAHQLNNNPLLIAEAQKRGLDGVAVSIHTNDGRTDVERAFLIQQVLKGRYLAVCADQFGREGFDWPACKAVYLYPGMSVPDAIQTFGRASRKYYDIIRQRFEGALFCTFIPYFADPNPVKNRQNAELAAKGIITAHHVRYDTFDLRAGKALDLDAAPSPARAPRSRLFQARPVLQPIAFPVSRAIAPPPTPAKLSGADAAAIAQRLADSYKALAAGPKDGSLITIDDVKRTQINGMIERLGSPSSARIVARLRTFERVKGYLPSTVNAAFIDSIREEGKPIEVGEEFLSKLITVLQTWPIDKVRRPMKDRDFDKIDELLDALGRPTRHEIAARTGLTEQELAGILERGPADMRLDRFEQLMTALTDWPAEHRFSHVPLIQGDLKKKYAEAQNPSWDRIMVAIRTYERDHKLPVSDLDAHMLSNIIGGDAVVKTTRQNLDLIGHALSSIVVENRARDMRLARKDGSTAGLNAA